MQLEQAAQWFDCIKDECVNVTQGPVRVFRDLYLECCVQPQAFSAVTCQDSICF